MVRSRLDIKYNEGNFFELADLLKKGLQFIRARTIGIAHIQLMSWKHFYIQANKTIKHVDEI